MEWNGSLLVSIVNFTLLYEVFYDYLDVLKYAELSLNHSRIPLAPKIKFNTRNLWNAIKIKMWIKTSCSFTSFFCGILFIILIWWKLIYTCLTNSILERGERSSFLIHKSDTYSICFEIFFVCLQGFRRDFCFIVTNLNGFPPGIRFPRKPRRKE
jgi:hypothetical protein